MSRRDGDAGSIVRRERPIQELETSQASRAVAIHSLEDNLAGIRSDLGALLNVLRNAHGDHPDKGTDRPHQRVSAVPSVSMTSFVSQKPSAQARSFSSDISAPVVKIAPPQPPDNSNRIFPAPPLHLPSKVADAKARPEASSTVTGAFLSALGGWGDDPSPVASAPPATAAAPPPPVVPIADVPLRSTSSALIAVPRPRPPPPTADQMSPSKFGWVPFDDDDSDSDTVDVAATGRGVGPRRHLSRPRRSRSAGRGPPLDPLLRTLSPQTRPRPVGAPQGGAGEQHGRTDRRATRPTSAVGPHPPMRFGRPPPSGPARRAMVGPSQTRRGLAASFTAATAATAGDHVAASLSSSADPSAPPDGPHAVALARLRGVVPPPPSAPPPPACLTPLQTLRPPPAVLVEYERARAARPSGSPIAVTCGVSAAAAAASWLRRAADVLMEFDPTHPYGPAPTGALRNPRAGGGGGAGAGASAASGVGLAGGYGSGVGAVGAHTLSGGGSGGERVSVSLCTVAAIWQDVAGTMSAIAMASPHAPVGDETAAAFVFAPSAPLLTILDFAAMLLPSREAVARRMALTTADPTDAGKVLVAHRRAACAALMLLAAVVRRAAGGPPPRESGTANVFVVSRVEAAVLPLLAAASRHDSAAGRRLIEAALRARAAAGGRGAPAPVDWPRGRERRLLAAAAHILGVMAAGSATVAVSLPPPLPPRSLHGSIGPIPGSLGRRLTGAIVAFLARRGVLLRRTAAVAAAAALVGAATAAEVAAHGHQSYARGHGTGIEAATREAANQLSCMWSAAYDTLAVHETYLDVAAPQYSPEIRPPPEVPKIPFEPYVMELVPQLTAALLAMAGTAPRHVLAHRAVGAVLACGLSFGTAAAPAISVCSRFVSGTCRSATPLGSRFVGNDSGSERSPSPAGRAVGSPDTRDGTVPRHGIAVLPPRRGLVWGSDVVKALAPWAVPALFLRAEAAEANADPSAPRPPPQLVVQSPLAHGAQRERGDLLSLIQRGRAAAGISDHRAGGGHRQPNGTGGESDSDDDVSLETRALHRSRVGNTALLSPAPKAAPGRVTPAAMLRSLFASSEVLRAITEILRAADESCASNDGVQYRTVIDQIVNPFSQCDDVSVLSASRLPLDEVPWVRPTLGTAFTTPYHVGPAPTSGAAGAPLPQPLRNPVAVLLVHAALHLITSMTSILANGMESAVTLAALVGAAADSAYSPHACVSLTPSAPPHPSTPIVVACGFLHESIRHQGGSAALHAGAAETLVTTLQTLVSRLPKCSAVRPAAASVAAVLALLNRHCADGLAARGMLCDVGDALVGAVGEDADEALRESTASEGEGDDEDEEEDEDDDDSDMPVEPSPELRFS